MKSLAILTIALASVAFADPVELTSVPVARKLKEVENHNELSFGPDVFWQHFNEKKGIINAESNGVFGGARLRYEYVKPNAFYAGTDGMFAAGRVTRELTQGDVVLGNKETAFVANAEQRFGYTLGVDGKRSSLTPFAGIGWYYTKPVADSKFSNDFVYAAAGFKSNTQVSDSFAIGLTGKALYSFYDRTHVDGVTNSTWDKTAWGVEVDVPMTWHLDTAKTWDLTLEPYFQDLDIENNFMNAGGRLLTSYQF